MSEYDIVETAKQGFPPVFQESVDAWLRSLLNQGKAENTLTTYARALRLSLPRFSDILGKVAEPDDLRTLPKTAITQFAAELEGEGASGSRINQTLSALRSFTKSICRLRGHRSAFEFVRNVSLVEPIHLVTTGAEIEEKIVAQAELSADNEPWIAFRDDAIATLIALTGATVGEVVMIQRSHGEIGTLETIELSGAGRLNRAVDLAPLVRERVARYLDACPFKPAPEDPLFIGARGGQLSPRVIQLALERMEDSLGMPRGSNPRSLRAGTIMLLRKEGFRDFEIAARLGMKGVKKIAQILAQQGEYPATLSIKNSIRNPTSISTSRGAPDQQHS